MIDASVQSKKKHVISPNQVVLKLDDIIELYAMSRSSIYRAMAENDFPLAKKLTGRSVCWSREAVENWFASRPSAINPCADAAQYQTDGYLNSRPSAG